MARTVGINVDGISLGKHFVVGIGTGDERLYVDPYHSGGLLSRKECIVSMVGSKKIGNGDYENLERTLLKPVKKRAMLRRLLSNLKVAHEKQKQYELALSASERIQPVSYTHLTLPTKA